MKWKDFRKVSVCRDITEEEREKIDSVIEDKIKKKIGEKTPYSKIVIEKSDTGTKKWIWDILTKESMLSVRSEFLTSAYVLLLTAIVLFFIIISPNGIQNLTKTFFASITGAIKSLSFDIGKILVFLFGVVAFFVLFFFLFLLIVTAISNALMLFVYRKQIASPKDLQTLFKDMDKRWHVIFVEGYAIPFLKKFHLFNDIRVIIEEEAQPSMPIT